jgi:hypothetical protein
MVSATAIVTTATIAMVRIIATTSRRDVVSLGSFATLLKVQSF